MITARQMVDLIRKDVKAAEDIGEDSVVVSVSMLKMIAVLLHAGAGAPAAPAAPAASPPAPVPRPTGDVCTTCGGMLVQTGKCRTCQSCGSSDGGCS